VLLENGPDDRLKEGGCGQGSLIVVEGAVLWQEFGWVNCCINFDSLSLSQGLRERRHHLGKLRVLFAFLWIKREGALLLFVL